MNTTLTKLQSEEIERRVEDSAKHRAKYEVGAVAMEEAGLNLKNFGGFKQLEILKKYTADQHLNNIRIQTIDWLGEAIPLKIMTEAISWDSIASRCCLVKHILCTRVGGLSEDAMTERSRIEATKLVPTLRRFTENVK